MEIFDNFLESGIYLVIVFVAIILVVIIVAILYGSMKPKKKKRIIKSLPSGQRKLEKANIKLLKEGPKEDHNKKERKNKKETSEKPDLKPEIKPVLEEKNTNKSAVDLVDIPELPPADVLSEDDEVENENNTSSEDLMSVFQVEEVEDTYVSDLAANLFDVDVKSIETLSREMLEVLSGDRPSDDNKEE